MPLPSTRNGQLAIRLAFVGLATATGIGWSASPASAHAELASSNPAEAATVNPKLKRIELRFTKDAELAADGLRVVGPQGEETVTPRSSEGGQLWTFVFGRDLAVGPWQVEWKIQAGDTHTKSGTISFRVSDEAGSASGARYSRPSTEPQRDSGTPVITGERSATWGRIVWMIGLVLPAGVIAFMLWAFEGVPSEVGFAQRWIRALAAIGLVGTVVELLGNLQWSGEGTAALWGPIGLAAALRVAAGAVFLCLHLDAIELQARAPAAAMTYASDGALLLRRTRTSAPTATNAYLARLRSPSVVAFGTVALVGSMMADGHSLENRGRVLMWLATTVHVGAGAIWAGGVSALVLLLSSRWLRGRQMDGARLGFRFSSLAAASLVAVAIAGVFLAVDTLESPGQLFTSTWGRALVVKLLAVIAAAFCGAFNHFILLPELAEFERLGPSAKAAAEHHLRRVGTIELTAMLIVLAATAWMVGSSPT